MSDSENKGMSSSETAYRAVLEVQAANDRAERSWGGPDVSNQQSTPLIVWGALFGLVVGAFGTGKYSFLASIGIVIASMAICAGIVWGIGKAFRIIFRTEGVAPNVMDGKVEGIAGALAEERYARWRRRRKYGAIFGTIAAILLAVFGESVGSVVFGFFFFGLIGALLSRFVVRKSKAAPRTPEPGPPSGDGWAQGR
jgi:hypothetical protein